MFRTNYLLISAFFLYFVCAHQAVCQADSPSNVYRDVLIQKEMDCVSRQLKSPAIDWQDLCDMPDASSQNPMDKSEVVNRQLDAVENSRAKTGTHGPRVHTFDVGAEAFYYRYQEPDAVDVKIRGPMYGYYANYAYRPSSTIFNNLLTNVYFLQGRYATSRDLEYSGSGIIKGKHDDAMEFRGLIGKDYDIDNALVTPYFGFGYRYLLDRGNGQISSSDNWGYDRKSHYYYLPMGAYAAFDMPNNWETDFNAEYDILLQGMQKSFLSDGNQFFGSNYPDLVNHQDHGFGVRASVKFLKRGCVVDFYVEPYVRFWNIEQSKEETILLDGTMQSLVEPKNNTTEVGSKFGIQF